jgi:PhnB protein
MKAINPYLNFDGNTREAMTFYAKTLGGDLAIQTYKEAGMVRPTDDPNRVIHARLSKGSTVIMASDTPPGMPVKRGDNVWVCVQCDDVPEVTRFFSAFSDGGTVLMPLQDMFWGARFGMLTDKYGIGWMFNAELPKKKS